MQARSNTSLSILRQQPGRALLVESDGHCYLGHQFDVYVSADDGKSWSPVLSVPRARRYRVVEFSRMACRLFRHEIRALIRLSDGTFVAASRLRLFRAGPGEREMTRSMVVDGGLRAFAPRCLGRGPNDCVVWGEYWANPSRRAVRIFASRDGGRSFEVAHVFKPGQVRHIHNIVYAAGRDCYWVLTGDHREEPGIGRLSADFKCFDWLVKGKQAYRAVCLFDQGAHLLYGTDSEKEPNAVIRLEKSSGRIERIQELDGSCLHACRFGRYWVLSTSVEPSAVNRSPHADLWVSTDGETWSRIYQARKDRWNATYFQFGSIVLPCGSSPHETLLFSGQALAGIDGLTLAAEIADAAGSGEQTRGSG